MWISHKRPIIALAPMADMTDSPFCRVCREVSGGDFVIFREMVSAEAIVRGSEKTLKMCGFEEIERPIVLQIFGGDPKVMRQAAEIIVRVYKPDGIDVNMGCPVPKIAGKSKAGAALMKDHERAVAIIKELKAANLGVPVSVKTRLGWSKDDEILEFAQKLEEAGVDAITIHGRTKKQGYSGVANWDMIGKVKKLLSIPVIANGDIHSQEDIKRCLEITGADGVMIGRAVLGNPWIFSFCVPPPCRGRSGGGLNDCGDLTPTPLLQGEGRIDSKKLKQVVLRHAELHLEHYGEKYGLKTFRKHLLYYFRGFDGVKELRQELVKVETIGELEGVLGEFPPLHTGEGAGEVSSRLARETSP